MKKSICTITLIGMLFAAGPAFVAPLHAQTEDPELDTSPGNKLAITLDLKQGHDFSLVIDIDGRYNDPGKEIGKFHLTRKVSGYWPQTILLEDKDFEKGQNKNENDRPLEWLKITTFTISLTDA